MSDGERRGILRDVAGEVQGHWRHVALLGLISLLATPLALLAPLPLKLVVDNVLGDRPLPGWLESLLPHALERRTGSLLVALAVLQVVLVLLRELQGMALYVMQTWTGEQLTLRFRSRLLAHAHRVSFAFHDARGTSDSIYRIQYDAKAIESLVVYALIPQLTAAATFVGMVVVIVTVELRLALIALAVAPLFVGYQRYFRRRMRPRYAESKRIESGVLKVVHESLGAFRVVKAFGREDHELELFRRHAQDGLRQRLRLVVAEGAFFLVVSVTTAVGSAVVLYVGARQVQSGRITLGDLLLVLGYLTQLYAPLQKLANAAANNQSHLASAERAFELLREVPDVLERPRALPVERARGGFTLRRVWFSYTPGQPVLRAIDLRIPPGSRLGIAGRTGSGKTTLVSLLLRFYDVDKGAVLLDGTDVRDLRLADLRRQFSIVLQEPLLFSTSIAENIAYARPEATAADIEAAARAAGAHEFVTRLPDGYDTAVGERGLRLSGGERQRVALARAFLRDAPVLILDEPTSSVDVVTERSILAALDRLMEGRTVIMIAHRLSTLAGCDEVIVLDDGRLAKGGIEALAGVSTASDEPGVG